VALDMASAFMYFNTALLSLISILHGLKVHGVCKAQLCSSCTSLNFGR
jgi:hypothetical protein